MAFCCSMSAQSMKVVVNSDGEVLGRYVRTNDTTYTISVQDDVEVPRAGNHVEVFSAVKGRGVVYRSPERVGNINVRKGPSTKTAVIAKIGENDGVPDVFDCLGKTNGWYKISINDKIGYVRADLMVWDAICTF